MADPKAHYSFLAWYRTGLGSSVTGTDQGRATLDVIVKANVGANPVDGKRKIHLIGPGDIVGIDPRAVVRTDPRPFTNDFEPNFLAAIEFFDEDYPFRYSPKPPDNVNKGRLNPWISLIVVEESEIKTFKDQGTQLPRALVINSAILPPPGETWAWAHAHLNNVDADTKKPAETADQIKANPAASCSRIVAARHLQPLKAYRAFLVPTFESGRRAGLLSKTVRNEEFAWGAAGDIELPIYYEWAFRTGEKGDFKELASRLTAKPPPATVGRRPMDVSRPLESGATPPILNTDDPALPVLDLEGALQVPSATHSGWADASRKDFQNFLADFVNLADTWEINVSNLVKGTPKLPNGITLPVIVPPSYGNHHANAGPLVQTESTKRWLEQLNLDPRNRTAAAFGTLVVQKNQEDFMARAWKQYGELFEANRFRYRAQLFREVLSAIETKHISPLADEKALAITGLAQSRILVAGDERKTVFGLVDQSALPVAALQPPMRRIMRENGRVAERFGSATPHLREVIRDVGEARRAVSPAWTEPQERLTLSTAPPAVLQTEDKRFVGIEWDQVKPSLVAYRDTTSRLARQFPQFTPTLELIDSIVAIGEAQATLSAARLTLDEVKEVRDSADFRPEVSGRLREEDFAPAERNPNFTFIAWNYRQAILNSTELLTRDVTQAAAKPALNIGKAAVTVRQNINPYLTVSERVSKIIQIPPGLQIPPYDPLEAIMAHPRFDDATYEYLHKISDEFLVPNLDKLENNTITLLEVNWEFIESFMVGLNHEMARELLWRGYRTDQRGSYFRQFWDVKNVPQAFDAKRKVKEEFLDIHPIHGWKSGGLLRVLGINRPQGRPVMKNLVLVIRGDLLRRYPNTQVYAVKAIDNKQPRAEFKSWKRRPTDGTTPEVEIKYPILFAKLGADIYCYGFNLVEDEAAGAHPVGSGSLGWYFALAERYGEPRFGLDANGGAPSAADTLGWSKVGPGDGPPGALNLAVHKPPNPSLITDSPTHATWSGDAADMAAILLRKPYRIFRHADLMIRQQ